MMTKVMSMIMKMIIIILSENAMVMTDEERKQFEKDVHDGKLWRTY